jgi:hypothetical protein
MNVTEGIIAPAIVREARMAISSKEEQRVLGKIVPIVKILVGYPSVKAFLEGKKQQGRELLLRRDFIWHEILLSFATWGSSRGARRLNFDALAYEKLSSLDSEKRRSLVESEFKAAGLRYATKKIDYLLYNFCLVAEKGGVDAANRAVLDDSHGPEAKKKALMEYKGIGKKYAYNIMMDAYHPEFHDSIAVDQRIKNISKELGVPANKYDEYVNFYQNAASEIGIDPWDLDRVLYKFQKPVLESLRAGTRPTAEMAQEALVA